MKQILAALVLAATFLAPAGAQQYPSKPIRVISIFAPDRPSYNVPAANDGWERIEAFFGRHLGS